MLLCVSLRLVSDYSFLCNFIDQSESDQEDENNATVTVSSLSDMDYLKSKMVTQSKDDNNSDDEEMGADDDDEMGTDDGDDSDDKNESTDEYSDEEKASPMKSTAQEKSHSESLWTLKMRGLPFRVKDKQVIEFFSPIKCIDIRFVNNKKGQRSGRAFVDFNCKEDLEKALKRDKDYLEGRYIELFRDDTGNIRQDLSHEQDEKPWMKKLREGDNDEDESIGEVSTFLFYLLIKMNTVES
jgi:multiple RNA-binding domain-containing protein 1